MHTFYYFEGKIYETKAQIERAMKDYNIKRYDVITTNRLFEDFEADFQIMKDEGESDFDAIEWAKGGI